MPAVAVWNDLQTLYDRDFGRFSQRFREEFLGPQCLCLRVARALRDAPAEFQKLRGGERILHHYLYQLAAGDVPFLPVRGPLETHTVLAARMLLAEAALGEPAQMTDQVRRAIRICHRNWWLPDVLSQPRPVTHVDPRPLRGLLSVPAAALPTPGWYHRLPRGWDAVFASLARELADGWLDPALNLAGETISWIWQDRDPWPAQPAVTTWLLLVERQSPGEAVGGTVAELQVWRTAAGTGQGCLYPHPLANGCLRSTRSFQESLQNAWWAELRPFLAWCPAGRTDRGPVDYDLCWSLRVLSPRDKLPVAPRLAGRSGEAALACALRAVREDEPLDGHTAVSAQLKEALCDNRELAPVAGVDAKLTAAEFGRRFRAADLWDVVLHADQAPDDQTIRRRLDPVRVHRVGHLDGAYGRLSQWSLMTRHANRCLAKRSRAELEDTCCGEKATTEGGYVLSDLVRLEDPPRPGTAPAAGPPPPPRPIADSERRSLVTATHPQRRLRFFGESGIGKSTFLKYCQQQIAAADTGQVPVLLTALSAWAIGDERAFERKLVGHFAELFAADSHHPPYERRTIRDWVRRLWYREGKLVFLLDALDQTDARTQAGLHGWLHREIGGFRRCRVYLTGRLAMRQAGVFAPTRSASAWDTFLLRPFTDLQVKQFFGESLAAYFRLFFPGDSADGGPSPVRIPIVAALLKSVAASPRYRALTNRERIYQAALEWPLQPEGAEGLISKGLRSAQQSRFAGSDLHLIRRVVAVLGVVAWKMLFEDGNATGFAEGRAYDGLEQAVRKFVHAQGWSDAHLMDTLTQINILTGGAVLEHAAGRIEWRHLSFCEYFAGVHLAEALTADEQARAVAPMLDMVRAVQEARAAAVETPHPKRRSPLDRWHWVFRFALGRASANTAGGTAQPCNPHARDDLARLLIAHGNPYVVYDALRQDRLVIDPRLDRLGRWLVHQTRSWKANYHDAWPAAEPPPETDARTLDILATLCQRRYRNGPLLPPAWRLLAQARQHPDTAAQAQEIQASFYTDAVRVPEDGNPGLSAAEHQILAGLLDSFRPCPPDPLPAAVYGPHFQPGPEAGSYIFQMGASPGDPDTGEPEQPTHLVLVRGMAMSEFCVTNEAWELFDPAHYWWRDRFSAADDQPALYVNWYMADFFARVWLTENAGRLPGRPPCAYSLPTECQWEFAARAGALRRYWWDQNAPDPRHFHAGEDGRWCTLGRGETQAAHRNGFGLAHMLGNNWQWCADCFRAHHYRDRTGAGAGGPAAVCWEEAAWQAGAPRTLRGGAFRYDAVNCRVSHRYHAAPDILDHSVGVRIVAAS